MKKSAEQDQTVRGVMVKLQEANNKAAGAASKLAAERDIEISEKRVLLQLHMEQHRLRHEALAQQYEAQDARLKRHWSKHQELVELKGEKACEDSRAALVTAQAKLEMTKDALALCLKTKKEIQARIEKVGEEHEKAQQSLEACLRAKAVLKKKIESCHDRRDAAREKLASCLARKKELNKLIEDCHT